MVSNLVSFINVWALDDMIVKDLQEKMNSNDGNFAATIFAMMSIVLSEGWGTPEDFGCEGVGF